jgi:hypothetical protein
MPVHRCPLCGETICGRRAHASREECQKILRLRLECERSRHAETCRRLRRYEPAPGPEPEHEEAASAQT